MPSPSNEYLEINKILFDIERDLISEWPIIPRENLEAGKIFLMHVFALIKKNPDLTADDCVLQTVDEFEKISHPIGLAKVTTMQPNLPVFNWRLFSIVFSYYTPLGEFIEKIRARSLEKDIVEKTKYEALPWSEFIKKILASSLESNVVEKPKNEALPLLNSNFGPIKGYGAC